MSSDNELIALPVLLWDDPDPSWRNDAACKPEPEMPVNTPTFFGVGGANKVAVAVCNDICPVRERCLEFALRNRQMFGTWGGYTQEQLRTMHREAKDALGY